MSGDNFSFTPTNPSVTDGVVEGSLFFPAQQHTQVIELVGHLCRYSNLMLTITGAQGSGKSLLKNRILDSLDAGVQVCNLNVDAIVQAQPFLNVLCQTLNVGLDNATDLNQYLIRLKQHFYQLQKDGNACLIVIDDADKLSSETLEILVILLSDDDDLKRPHVLLLGENSLIETLQGSRLKEQFNAIGHHLALEPFGTEEAWSYLDYRINAAGLNGQISDHQKADIIRASGRIPGQINRMANLALSDPDGLKKVAAITTKASPGKKAPKAAPAAATMSATDFVEAQTSATAPTSGLKADNDTKKTSKKRKSSKLPVMHLAALAIVASLLGVAFLYQDEIMKGGQSAEEESVADNTPLTDLNRLQRPADEALAEAESLKQDQEAVTIIKPVFPQENSQTTEEKRQADADLLADNKPAPAPITTATPVEKPVVPAETVKPAVVQPAPTTAAVPAPAKPQEVAKPEPKPAPKPAAKPTSPYKQEAALLKLTSTQYTLQLLGTQIENNAINFINGLNSKTNVRYFETIYKGKPWFVVIYGEFTNRDAAIASIPKLPAELKDRKPWARSIASVQADIRKK